MLPQHFWHFHEQICDRTAGRRRSPFTGPGFPPGPPPGRPPSPPGAPPFGPPGFPFGFGGRPPWGRQSRARRGEVRVGILLLLQEQPMNGYQLIQEFEKRSQGTWRPSSGAIYPALELLEDEGLVRPERNEAGRLFHLTDEGKKYCAEHAKEIVAPWEPTNDATDPRADMAHQLKHLSEAAVQVLRAGTPEQLEEARRIMIQARRSLYRILASDDGDEE